MENRLTLEKLKEALLYDQQTGNFIWREDRPLSHFKHEMAYKVYRTRFASVVAGHCQKGLNTSYLTVRIFDKLYLAHRLVWFYIYRVWPNGEIDHIDGNGLNNKLVNLRDVSKVVNGKNSQRKNNNTSGVNGVYFHKQSNKWCAEGHYTENNINKKKYLGLFVDLLDAAKAREKWEKDQGGFSPRHGLLSEEKYEQ